MVQWMAHMVDASVRRKGCARDVAFAGNQVHDSLWQVRQQAQVRL